MRHSLYSAAVVLLLAGGVWAQNPPTVAVPAETRPNFVAIDQVVLNLNAVAGIHYAASSGGGALISVTYLNGVVTSYRVTLTAEDWKKVQAEIVKAGK
jgi:hypothetical protein